jgi:hypothetical protein
MSAANFFNTEKRAVELRTVDLTTSSSLTTYTAKTGRVTDNFVMDRVINVTTTSGNSMTITVPDGVYPGQLLLVSFVTEGSAETVDVSTTTGDDATQMTDDGGYWLGIWTDSVNGWATLKYSAT